MSVFDIIVIAIIAIAAVVGLFTGVLRAILRFAEVIVTLGVSAAAAMSLVWLGIVNLEEVQDFSNFMESGLLYMIIAFVVMFIVSVVVCDYFVNKIAYKRKLGITVADKILGMILNAVLWSVIVMALFGIIALLEGTEYDPYVAMASGANLMFEITDGQEGSLIIPYLFDNNPFVKLFSGLDDVRNTMVSILNMIWPHFEYLG